MNQRPILWQATLPDNGSWKDIAFLEPHSLVKLEAWSSENNHYQPWEIYFMRAYPDAMAYPPMMAKMALPVIHVHSADVEWNISIVESTGKVVIRARKKDHLKTIRVLSIHEPLIGQGGITFIAP